ncbi:MAG: HDIG domain-containing protein [Limnochordaceae bacterium]|nr:HDIG domain-containing protein [Limnochordaceae bacterium]
MRIWTQVRNWLAGQIDRQLWRTPRWRRGLLLAVLMAAVIGIWTSSFLPQPNNVRVGEVASTDIVSPRLAENRPLTQALRDEAARQAELDTAADPANYEVDPLQAQRADEVIQGLFARLEAVVAASTSASGSGSSLAAGSGPASTPAVHGNDGSTAATNEASHASAQPVTASTVEQVWRQIRDELRIDLGKQTVQTALASPPDRLVQLQQVTRNLVLPIMREERISPAGLDQARELVSVRVEKESLSASERAMVSNIARAVLRPNLMVNPVKLEQARQMAMAQVQPIIIQPGQVIVRRGDVITAENISVLQDLGLLRSQPNWWALVGILCLAAVVFLLSWSILRRFGSRQTYGRDDKTLTLFGVVQVLTLLFVRLATLIPWPNAGLLAPLAFGTLSLALLTEPTVAFIGAALSSFLVIGVTGWDSPLPWLTLVSGWAWVALLPRHSQRGDVTRVGLQVGVVNALALGGVALVFSRSHTWAWTGLGLVNGLSDAIITLGLLPYLESVFGITSSIRLLELSNPNQPLLRKLMLETPGTYHHSIMVGNLAEAAAQAIGADALLVRVGAQYHDIGKTKRPLFFIENQFGGDNPHDHIGPWLSARILQAHVKDGVAMARQARLPANVIDFIEQHHGTLLIPFFYHKAIQETGDANQVAPADFRYPGPRPQSREVAIVMLADACEATVRASRQTQPARVEQIIRRIIRDRLDDGQLDESELTLRDLEKIAQAFLRVLTGLFHARIEYPAEQERRGRTGWVRRTGKNGAAAGGRPLAHARVRPLYSPIQTTQTPTTTPGMTDDDSSVAGTGGQV